MRSVITHRGVSSGPLPHLTLPPPLRARPAFIAMVLLDVPLAVVGMASAGPAQLLNALFAGAWFALVTSAVYNRWARLALPVAAGVFLAFVVAVLPFNSPAFVVDYWTAIVLFLLSLPARGSARS